MTAGSSRSAAMISTLTSVPAGKHGAVRKRRRRGPGPARRGEFPGTRRAFSSSGRTLRTQMPRVLAAVDLADDELLGHVDEPAGQVAGVSGTQGGVSQAFAGAVGRDEVLEHRKAFPERRDDRAGDHFASGVGDQALHTGDLADLLGVTTSARVDHHVQGVEGDLAQALLHGLARLRSWPWSRSRSLSGAARRR